MINIIKTITFIGALLGLIIAFTSIIKWKKIRREFEKAPDDELLTKDDERRLKRLFLLWIIGISLSIFMGLLSFTFELIKN